MADYYPLLARAVTGLQSSTLETRQAIYDRARNALIGQLRSITPALPEQDIERESKALDVAVKRLEDELAVEAARRRRTEKTTDVPAADDSTPAADERADARGRQQYASPRERAAEADGDNGSGQDAAPYNRRTRPDRRRVEPMHPAAPTPKIPYQNKARIWIVGVTIVAVVAMIAVTAYFLRQRPEDLAADKPADAVVAPVTGAGKIIGRIGGDGQAAASSPVPSVPVAVVPIEVPKPGPAAKPNRPAAAGTPAKPTPPTPVGTPSKPASSGPATAQPTTTGVPAPQKPIPTIPVAYRAALLVQAERSSEHKTYVGTVVWRLDSVTGDPGQPLQTALRADVDIPDAKIKVSLLMQKNTDPALSASHTIVLGFIVAPGGAFKGVRSIQMPQMREENSPNGDSLIGIGIVPITPTYFLVGLQQGDRNQTRNFDLLTTRNWIDVQFVLDDGRAAKITFEKGAQGAKDLLEAIAAWK